MKEQNPKPPRRSSEKSSNPEPAPKRAKPSPTQRSVTGAPSKSGSTAKPVARAASAETPSGQAGTPAKPKMPKKTAKTSPALKVPPILLEGDQPTAPAPGGPGQRYALGPTPPTPHVTSVEGELPEAFGTEQLFLTARDPRWLYAAWDMTSEQLRHYNALSIDRHLVLRVYKDTFDAPPLLQIHVHPESRNWFVPVPSAATKYMAELGYYTHPSDWVSIAKSAATLTPPDTLAEEGPIRFATFAPEVPFSELVAVVKSAAREHVPLVEALDQLRAEGFDGLPGAAQIAAGHWTAAQEQALGQVLSIDQVRRVWVGSLEITELIRRQLEQQISSISLGQVPSSIPAGISSVSSISSPFGGMERRKGFWFNVNAELIIYGATEPDAKVTIAGRQIKLRPDGTFSFRFALPDGQYDLPAIAVSVDGDDARQAALHFSRATEYQGDVGKHPQDAALKPPVPAAVS